MDVRDKPRVLCVDDEPHVVEGLALNLRRKFDVATAKDAASALELLRKEPRTAVVISDMRMPGMDGATFLARVREILPDTVRILLTGHTELTSAIRAVNDGQLFRFLTKPCPPANLLAVVEAAVEQHDLQCAERILLEQTLHGSIRALTEVLALTNPLAFGRATRIKAHVSELAAKLGLKQRWQVEVASMLSQLGCITLPAETVEKLYFGKPLTDAEHKMTERVPSVTETLLAKIPRLEVVRAILASSTRPFRRAAPGTTEDAGEAFVRRCAQILRVVGDVDVLEAQGNTTTRAFDTMRGRAETYDPEVLEAYAELRGRIRPREEIREIHFSQLRVGLIFAEDVFLRTGALLAAREFEVTDGFLERARTFEAGLQKPTVRVIVRECAEPAVRAA